MEPPSFKQYQPGTSSYAARISDEVWESYRDLLHELSLQGLSRSVMLETLAGRGFHPSRGQLNAKLQKWNVNTRVQTRSMPVESQEIKSNEAISTEVGTNMECIYPESSSPTELTIPPEATSCTLRLGEAIQEYVDCLISGSASPPNHIDDPEPMLLSDEKYEGIYSLSVLSNLYTGFGYAASKPATNVGSPTASLRRSKSFPSSYESLDRNHILQTLQLSRGGFWKQLIPDRCCCQIFFSMYGQERFLNDMYWNLLEKYTGSTTFGYAISVLYIWETRTTFTPVQDMILRGAVRELAKQFTSLATRAGIKNACVIELYSSIAKLYGSMFEEPNSLDIVWPRAYTCSKTRSISFYQTITTLENRLPRRIIPNLTTTSRATHPSALEFWPYVISEPENRAMIIGKLRECRDFLICNPGILLDCLESVSKLSINPQAYNEDISGLIDISCVPDIAARLSTYLLPVIRVGVRYPERSMLAESDQFQQDLASAFSLLVARALETLLNDNMGILTIHASVIGSVSALSGESLGDLPFTADFIPDPEQFSFLIEAIWMCRPSKQFLSGEQLVPHLESCEHTNISRSLAREVTDWDKAISWAEQKLQRATRRLPQMSTLPFEDAISIISSSSDNSFNRLRAFAMRISMQDDSPRDSTFSEWSGHISEDDWKLENIMEVDEIDIGIAV